MYSMLNDIIDSRKVRAQKAAVVAHSSGGSSFVPRRLEDWLEIEMLKESLRQRDKEMRRRDANFPYTIVRSLTME
jgi:hypothetical protein